MSDLDSPLRFYVGEDTRLPRRLREAMQARHDDMLAALGQGVAKTLEDYTRRVGELASLRWAIAECDNFAKELSKGN